MNADISTATDFMATRARQLDRLRFAPRRGDGDSGPWWSAAESSLQITSTTAAAA